MTKDILVFSGPEYAELCLDPDKSFYEDVSLAEVIRILECQESLWGQNTGGASLRWCSKEKYKGKIEQYKGKIRYVPNPNKPSLVILFNRDFGFHFRFETNDEQFISVVREVENSCVVQMICGQPAYFPSATFVSLCTARKIVSSFIGSGRRYNRIAWVESSSFRYDLPDEWKKLLA